MAGMLAAPERTPEQEKGSEIPSNKSRVSPTSGRGSLTQDQEEGGCGSQGLSHTDLQEGSSTNPVPLERSKHMPFAWDGST